MKLCFMFLLILQAHMETHIDKPRYVRKVDPDASPGGRHSKQLYAHLTASNGKTPASQKTRVPPRVAFSTQQPLKPPKTKPTFIKEIAEQSKSTLNVSGPDAVIPVYFPGHNKPYLLPRSMIGNITMLSGANSQQAKAGDSETRVINLDSHSSLTQSIDAGATSGKMIETNVDQIASEQEIEIVIQDDNKPSMENVEENLGINQDKSQIVSPTKTESPALHPASSDEKVASKEMTKVIVEGSDEAQIIMLPGGQLIELPPMSPGKQVEVELELVGISDEDKSQTESDPSNGNVNNQADVTTLQPEAANHSFDNLAQNALDQSDSQRPQRAALEKEGVDSVSEATISLQDKSSVEYVESGGSTDVTQGTLTQEVDHVSATRGDTQVILGDSIEVGSEYQIVVMDEGEAQTLSFEPQQSEV